MSGGDGIGHNSSSSGGINGGPTGFGGDGRNNGNAAYSDHSGWSSENNGWSNGNWGGSSGPDGSNSGNSGGSGRWGGKQAANSSRYAVADLRLVKPGYPVAAFSIGGTINATVCTKVPDNPFNNWGDYIDNVKPYAAHLARATRNTPVGKVASLLMSLEDGRKEYAAKLQQQMLDEARKEAAKVNVSDLFHVTTLPVAEILAASISMERIRELGKVLTKVVTQPVVDTKNQQRQIAITRQPTEVRVVKAEKTSKPNVYSAQVIAGMKPMQITVDNSSSLSQLNKTQVNTAPEVGIFSPTAADDTHHAILDFDGKHDPIYISVSKVPTEAEEKAQLEATKKREQEWLAENPLLAAGLELDEAQKEFASIDSVYQEKQNRLNQLLDSPEGRTLTNPVENPLVFQQTKEQFTFTKTEIKISDKALIDVLLKEGMKPYLKKNWMKINSTPGAVATLGAGIVGVSMGYEQLGKRLIEADKNINKAKQELAPVMEDRNKAENKKKEKKEKVEKESKKARDKPGIATGDGTDVGEKWLENVSKQLGSPIPKEIADKLRGKKFSSFDKLREAIWTEVGITPKLAQNVKTKANKKAIAKGRAPFARTKDQVGGRKKLELHHVDEIQHGGEVYNVDNLRVVTPKHHIKIHSK
ncbi:colicin-like bacteriocin tRNase domain-containing protein [Xenorhabdus hominickii]|uniref:Colicin-E9 n=1 Tax=Xenorhabdus hominickii TaxID=351679 RepID=A0A1V0M448_XENHO|nr:colicin-like bacteriocin tRNase domain-containing protein [Xenorhabdus hominickii]ARD69649.1 Colicin-E9 [Xenorhabdus hominickii]PHM52363.1 hypothetical protein Xhom_04440 [Xenorhabdus hominickii]